MVDTDGKALETVKEMLGEDPHAAAKEADPDVEAPAAAAAQQKWPGWPGDNVFRIIVPVSKVGALIGRGGDIIKKVCNESRARVRILEGAIGTPDRIVLISAKEETEAVVSPAMDAAIRIFNRVNNIPDNECSGTMSTGSTTCSIKLLVSSSQAINLIGKHGSIVKSIQEGSGAIVKVLSEGELPYYATSDERIVDILGEPLKVLKALEAVLGHLRKFLVHHSVIPLFEKRVSTPVTQDHTVETLGDKAQPLIHTAQQSVVGDDYPHPLNRDSLLDHGSQVDSQFQCSRLSIYGEDPALSSLRTRGLGHSAGPLVTQVTQTMEIPLSYAEDIIGIGGGNIAFIRGTSGALITLEESRSVPDEVVVEIKGNSTQVKIAQQLIQEIVMGHKEPISRGYGGLDTDYRPASTYSTMADRGYLSSSWSSQSMGGYGYYGLEASRGYRL